MTPSPAAPGAFRYKGWELRPQERLLLVRGEPVKVGSRAFDVLRVLAERAGQVVSKSELLDLAWPGLVVEENNLSVQVTALRRLLGAGEIVNVAGIGYRLAATPAKEEGPSDRRPPSAMLAPILFGRNSDLQALAPLVGVAPLVSIVGTGGVGKTSLARVAIARSPGSWRDGVHWIDLAQLHSAAPLPRLLAKSLGVLLEDVDLTTEDWIRTLAEMEALVTLDNCEHLLDGVASFVGPLLQHAPGLRWLATSQEPLRLAAESVYRLKPLDVPRPGAERVQATGSGALALFCERVRAADQGFELTADRFDTAAELCRQLDGLPLAIEIAAAQVASLGLQGVHDQIDQRLRLRAGARDAPQRHHTLMQTFEWSYGLLSAIEKLVFRRLQPFVGGFTTRLAQQLCCSLDGEQVAVEAWQVLDALSALVDKSLVQRSDARPAAGPERLHLLESARDYARLCLDAAGETTAMHQSHAEVVARWFDDASANLDGWRDTDWAARYLPERRNVCAALAWACSSREPSLLARLVGALAQLDSFAQTQAEVVQFAVPVDVLSAAALPLRARAYLEFGWAHYLDGSREIGTELSLQALSDYESLGDVAGAYSALTRLIRLYYGRPGLQDRAREMWSRLQQIDENTVPLRTRLLCQGTVAFLFGQARTVDRLQWLHRIAQRAGFEAQAAACSANITDELLIQGRFQEAADTARVTLQGDMSHLRMRAMTCHNQALALVRLGRMEEAQTAARAVLRALPSAAHMVMDLFALAAVQNERYEDAALMAGCSARIKRERDRHPETAEAAVIADTLQRLRDELGQERCAELMRLGADMPAADMLALALPP